MKKNVIGILYPQPPYAFDVLLDMLSRYAYPTRDLVHEDCYRRVITGDRGLGLVEVKSLGTLEKPALEVSLLAAQGKLETGEILDKLSHILAIDDNRHDFFELASQNSALWSVVSSVHGLPILRNETSYEALINVIIEQQILWTAAQRAQKWLIEWGNQFIEYKGANYFAYPTPTQLASANVEILKPLKITFRRMQLLIDSSNAVLNGTLDLEGLVEKSDEERYRYLLQVKGIGHWTAAVMLGRFFGHSSFITDNDVALQAAVNVYFYQQEGRATPQMVNDTFTSLGSMAGVASFYTLARWVLDRY